MGDIDWRQKMSADAPKLTESMTNTIQEVMRRYWGYDAFRPLQREAMEAVLAGRDSVVVLPTGGGKSLCFQAPAMILPGFAVVVSPLIALMKDQVDALNECGIPAARIDSSLSFGEQRDAMVRARTGALKLLYVAPERLCQEGFVQNLRESEGLEMIAIDEAHCISMWGHDFRPEYRMLGVLREAFPQAAFHAYTATATQRVRQDIVDQLALREPEVLVGSFDRPNLVYGVAPQQGAFSQMREIIDRHPGESGIIYCLSRRKTEELAQRLCEADYRAAPYHAGMNAGERKHNQDAFIRDEIHIITATVAFGMGIDKPDVRFVIHQGMPESLEHYQQQSGRAGRDGLRSECWLLWSKRDYPMWMSMFKDCSDEQLAIRKEKLGRMFGYADDWDCRHRKLVTYFGQSWAKGPCHACDVCLGDSKAVSADTALVYAQKILSCVKRVDESGNADYIARVLSGADDPAIQVNGHDTLSTFGLLAEVKPNILRAWTEQLVSQGCLRKVDADQRLLLTAKGWAVIRGITTPILHESDPQANLRRRLRTVTPDAAPPPRDYSRPKTVAPSPDELSELEQGLFANLKALRLSLAQRRHMPAFHLFGDITLLELARRRPGDAEAFQRIRGVGEQKAAKYAKIFIPEIRQYAESNGMPLNVFEEKEKKKSSYISPAQSKKNKWKAAQLFAQGAAIEPVASELGLAQSTVTGYLCEYIAGIQPKSLAPWVDANTEKKIRQAVQQTRVPQLKPTFDLLEEKVPYNDIRIVVTYLTHYGGETFGFLKPENI